MAGRKLTQGIHSEEEMAQAAALYLGNASNEVRVGGCRFDVVAYDENTRVFKLVECKKVSDVRRIGQTFGQVISYLAIVAEHGFEFVDEASKVLPMSFAQLERAKQGDEIHVEFYVALTDEACQRIALLRAIKGLLPDVGIIRVKRDGKCRDHIKDGDKDDYDLAKARAVTVKLVTPQAPGK